MSFTPIIICHGGAAAVEDSRVCGKMCGIKDAVRDGYKVMMEGNLTALDAVEAAIKRMEIDEFFNAGFGTLLTEDGEPEMDASIMDGKDLTCGSTTNVSNVLHPISLARLIKEKSPHCMIAGPGASIFAQKNGMDIVDPDSLICDYARHCLEVYKKKGLTDDTRELGGTVGCVAMDKNGNIAAGTSTGGANGKMKGRIGDTPIIGCGTYADNRLGGVSCTGHGESIIRVVMGHTIVKRLGQEVNPSSAIKFGLQKVVEIHGKGCGAICITKEGEVGLHFTTAMMPWAYIKDGSIHSGLKPGEDVVKGLT